MLQSFLFAIVSRRVSLLEEWENPIHPLLYYLPPNFINWAVQPIVPTEYNDTTEVAAYLARPQTHVIYDAIHEHPCNFELPKYNTKNHTGIRYTGNYFTKQGIIQREPCIRYLMEQHHEKDKFIGRTLFWTMFDFSPDVRQHANVLRGPIETNNYYIAAHIRTGNNPHWKDEIKHNTTEEWDDFTYCIQVLQDAMEQKCDGFRPMAYLASDSPHAKEYVQAQFTVHDNTTTMVHAPQVEIIHIDRSVTTDGVVQNTTSAYRTVVTEFKILLDATCLIASDSGFSRLAANLSRLQPRCKLITTQCRNPKEVREAVKKVPCPT
jgi:hypothetical protein